MSLVLIPYSLSFFSLFLYSTGTLPPEWGAMHSLRGLQMTNNQFSGKSDSCEMDMRLFSLFLRIFAFNNMFYFHITPTL